MVLACCSALLLVFVSVHQIRSASVDVDTTSGPVRGHTIEVLGKTINEFIGIPFGEPPVGDLRFEKPRPITTPWPTTIDATKAKFACMQVVGEIETPMVMAPLSEDCLYLNIWAPPSTHDDEGNVKLKPVMFWIYGGALKLGTIFSPMYNGQILATKDVIIVTANYRVGVFGFLYNGTNAAPGNAGMLDQVLALEWVRDNIKKFGGDPNQVTIFGESAGSWSVSAHLLSPLSKGLFKRAIMESGSVLLFKDQYPYTPKIALKESKDFAATLNCKGDDWVACLKKKPAQELTLDLEDLLMNFLAPPVINTDFLPEYPYKLFADGKYNSDVELIAGVNHDEGSYLAEVVDPTILLNIIGYTHTEFRLFVERARQIAHVNWTVDPIVNHYLKGVGILDLHKTKQRAVDFLGDVILKCPTYLFAKRYAELSKNVSNVYFYQLNYAPDFAIKLIGEALYKVIGVFHAAEIISVFGLPYTNLLKIGFDENDRKMSTMFMDAWTNFAKTGNPGNWKSLLDVTKSDHTHDETVRLLQPKDLEYSTNLFNDVCDGFWKPYFE